MRLQTLPDLPPDSIVFTVDVSPLYTSIPHSDGITACEEALETRVDKDPHTSILLKLIHFVLTNNYFEFNGEFFHQTHGTAMGTKMAPNYACIFMGKLEQELLESAQLHPLIWLRYIDDVLLIWTHGEATLKIFLHHLNSYNPTIKFTDEWSRSNNNFLDTNLYINGTRIYHLTTITK